MNDAAEAVRPEDRLFLVLSYLHLLALIPLFLRRDSAYVQWHAKNGLVLGLSASVALAVIAFIPIINLLELLLGPAVLIVHVIAIVKALSGVRWRVPVITDWAEKL